MKQVGVDVWSDYVCPFCYLEEPVLEQLVGEWGERVVIRWRAFELRPEPVPTLDPKGDYLREIWARAVYPMAKQRGMNLHLPPLQPRSRLAHESAKFAEAHDLMAPMNHALFQAFFEEGRDVGDRAVLADVARGVGLDEAALERALDRGTYREAVLADEELAQRLGLSAVPAMLIRDEEERIERSTVISGAQAFENVRRIVAAKFSGGDK